MKKLFSLGTMVTVNEVIDYDTAEIVASELNVKTVKEVVVTIEDRIIDDSADEDAALLPRDPVVVVMGHVDHGKTSLLDTIRHTSVTETEAGGITQHIGAYRVNITAATSLFDTRPRCVPSMRARREATDIALVVAADDGITPRRSGHKPRETAEANCRRHQQTINPTLHRKNYAMTGTNSFEEWGGDTIVVPVSAVTGLNIDKLLESVLLVADMKELRANPNRAARGIVIEARLDKGRGPIATLLVQNGTLKTGDAVVAGSAVGRVRVMNDDKGAKVETAGPSVPVEITGLDEAPQAGDTNAVSDERLARELVERQAGSERRTVQCRRKSDARESFLLPGRQENSKI